MHKSGGLYHNPNDIKMQPIISEKNPSSRHRKIKPEVQKNVHCPILGSLTS